MRQEGTRTLICIMFPFFLVFIKTVTIPLFVWLFFLNIWFPHQIIGFTRQVNISVLDHHCIPGTQHNASHLRNTKYLLNKNKLGHYTFTILWLGQKDLTHKFLPSLPERDVLLGDYLASRQHKKTLHFRDKELRLQKITQLESGRTEAGFKATDAGVLFFISLIHIVPVHMHLGVPGGPAT